MRRKYLGPNSAFLDSNLYSGIVERKGYYIEMISESIDETLDKDEAEEESEELTNQVLNEIGVDIASQLSSAPKGRIASRTIENVVPRSESQDVEELEKRLASLRRI